MLKKPKKVFLDANIVIGDGKPPGGPLLGRLKGLINDGLITLLTTDLTCQEVAKKNTETHYDEIRKVGEHKFRKLVKDALGTELPDINKTELKAKLAETYAQSTDDMFIELNCETLEIDKVIPSSVFSAYAAGEGFFTSTGKKDQFPDAFIFECIKAEASKEEPVIIVSNDGDFEKPAASEAHISLVKSLPDLFNTLGLQVEAPEVEDFLEHNNIELIKATDSELDNWGLVGDVEGSEITETIVTDVDVIELTSYASTKIGTPILVVGRLSVNVNVSYTHPNWDEAMYDSEDKCYFPFDDVSGETDVSFEVDVSMLLAVGKDGTPKDIEELRFRDDKFIFIELNPYDPHS